MDDPSVFNYLGEDIISDQICSVVTGLQACYPIGTPAHTSLSENLSKLKAGREKWPEKIFKRWRERILPVYSSEDITKISQSNASRLESINEHRKRLRDTLKTDILRHKKKIDDFATARDRYDDIYHNAVVTHRTQSNLLRNHPHAHTELQKLNADLHIAFSAYDYAIQRIVRQETNFRAQITAIEQDITPIVFLSTQGIQKHLLITKHLRTLGWMPSENAYVLLQNPRPPPDPEIFRRISHEPDSDLSNLPLSIFNLIVMADEIGSTDEALLCMICTYLKRFKPQILDICDSKKQSITAIMEILSFHCSTDNEKFEILSRLKAFRREPTESFASAVTRFESMYSFYLQLEKPSSAENIKLLSYQVLRQISQYLLSPKCSHQFGCWAAKQSNAGNDVTKESIIKIVTALENNPDLKLTSSRSLPGTLITTTLNLPVGQSETIMAHFANPSNPSKPKDLPKKNPPRSTSRNASGSRPRTPSGSNRPRTKSPLTSKDIKRKSSPSPNRNNNSEERGR